MIALLGTEHVIEAVTFAIRCASGLFKGDDERCAVLAGFLCLPEAAAAALAGCTATFRSHVFGILASGAPEEVINVSRLASF